MAAVVVGAFGVAEADRLAVTNKPVAKLRARLRAKPAAWKASPPAKPTPARLLRAEGMRAYKAGNYSAAVRKFAAAMDTSDSPELLYQAAQAYRLEGERAKALELYERYLDLAPDGSAAPVCRWYVERLRDTP